uniref:Uncharacterized protein n=1 Tax=Amphora coffeiformis TaxID=265554 RepID=A0A7S3LBT3_9STRA
MAPRRRETNHPVVKTFSRIPSSNVTVAQNDGNQRKVVVKLKGRKPTSSFASNYSAGKDAFMSTDDKHANGTDENAKPETQEIAKDNKPKIFSGKGPSMFQRSTSFNIKGPSIFQRSTSIPLRRSGRSGSLLSKPFQARRSRSDIQQFQNQVTTNPENMGRHAMEEEDAIAHRSDGSVATPSSQKHVAFTQEAIQTDLLNKERKRQQQYAFDPMSILSNLFCNVVPFSTFTGQASHVSTNTTEEEKPSDSTGQQLFDI